MTAHLQLEDVSFSYPGLLVLNRTSLSVQSGEMVALLGANGSGKSTLLRLAAGALQASAGKVKIRGRTIDRYRPRELAKLVAVLPQELHVPAGWNVREVVSLGRTPHIPLLAGETLADVRAIERALVLAECEGLAGREYATLSGGQKQRVGLATALAQEAEVLLLDEPTAHLDLHYRAAVLDSIAALQSELKMTVLAAMHDPSLAALYFPRLVLLSSGGVCADGPPERVLREDLLEEVYGAPVRVWTDPSLGVPLVTVLPAHLRDRPDFSNAVLAPAPSDA